MIEADGKESLFFIVFFSYYVSNENTELFYGQCHLIQRLNEKKEGSGKVIVQQVPMTSYDTIVT